MKTLLLENILTAINIRPNKKQKGIRVQTVTNDSSDIRSHTLFFRWNNREVPVETIKRYKNVFIVTDTSFSQMERLNPEQVIMVKDLEKSFFKFTSYYRHLFNIPVVAITGTCGKSTTKEMLKHILDIQENTRARLLNSTVYYKSNKIRPRF